jgi:hypothetical protein
MRENSLKKNEGRKRRFMVLLEELGEFVRFSERLVVMKEQKT